MQTHFFNAAAICPADIARTTHVGGAAGGRWYARREAIMGTAIHAELWCDDPQLARTALAAVMQEMHRIDACLSPYKPGSELSCVNREAGAGPVRISRELFALLEESLRFSVLSEGAFDITYASVGRLYDYRNGIRPTDEALAQANSAVGYRNLELDCRRSTVRFMRPGMAIDLGGFAKGYAADNAAWLLASLGIQHAIVSAGGDSRVLGDRRGRPWTVGIRDPRIPGSIVAILPLEQVSVSTSGDYERYFEQDGRRHHHVLDPATGCSPDQIRSVTVVAPDGLTSEALSKSIFVMGIERGMALLARLAGVDAVVVDAAGRLHYSAGLMQGGPALIQ